MTASPIWIAPTRIHRLLQCLASGEGSRNPAQTQRLTGLSADIGSIAHRALERWVRDGLWQPDKDGIMLRLVYEEEGRKSTGNVNVQPGGRLLGLRLKNLGKLLRDKLSAAGPDQVFPELMVDDHVSHIRGVIDLLIVEDHVLHIYDYKTGRSAFTEEGRIADSVRTQLVAYGIMLSRGNPGRQLRLSVVSPQRGIIDVAYDARQAAAIESRVAEFQELTDSQRDQRASPNEDCCRFCPRRLRCDPHWEAAENEGWTDLIEGEVINVRRSESGQFAVAVKAHGTVSWILNLDPALVPAAPERLPPRLRGVRLKPVRAEGSKDLHFRANAGSDVMLF